ncbi:hypothetical protein EJB05_05727, partial [Eragrostis curvula]
MERKQGFFAALRDEVARGLSPARARRKSEAAKLASALRLARRPGGGGGGGGGGEALSPLMEGPDPESGDGEYGGGGRARKEGWAKWVRFQLARTPYSAAAGAGGMRVDIRLMLGVMGAPLGPVHVRAAEPLPDISLKDSALETSSVQYILQQYLAASGGHKLLASVRNAYTMGKVRMVATEEETAGRVVKNRNAGPGRGAETGRFVLWQMAPDRWYIEMAVGGSKVHAGCNGSLVWRHTPWLGAHAAKGPVRPLRRAIQGLDPLTTASMFAGARCLGEKKVNGEDCFILKLSADPETLKARGEGPAELIRHVMFGSFSQRTGLLVHIEDSHLTRIQSTTGGDAIYWETTINSLIEDYRPVDGIMVAHSGRAAVTVFRFGEVAMSHTKNRMEETWSIEEVAFDVPGLSMDCFIPPTDIMSESADETIELSHGDIVRAGPSPGHSAKVAALEKAVDDKVAWCGTILEDHN